MKRNKTVIICSAVMSVVLASAPVMKAQNTPAPATPSAKATQKQLIRNKVNELAAELNNPQVDDVTKANACVQLENLGPKAAPAVPALENVLTSPNPSLRGYAIITLMKIGAPYASPAEPTLHTMANTDPDANVRKAASAAIVSLDSKKNLLTSFFGKVTDPFKQKSINPAAQTPAPGQVAGQNPLQAQDQTAGQLPGQTAGVGTPVAVDPNAGTPASQFQQIANAEATQLGLAPGTTGAQALTPANGQVIGGAPTDPGTPTIGTVAGGPAVPGIVDPNAANSSNPLAFPSVDGTAPQPTQQFTPQAPTLVASGQQLQGQLQPGQQFTGQQISGAPMGAPQPTGTVVVVDNSGNPLAGNTDLTQAPAPVLTGSAAGPQGSPVSYQPAQPIAFQPNTPQTISTTPGATETIIIENQGQGQAMQPGQGAVLQPGPALPNPTYSMPQTAGQQNGQYNPISQAPSTVSQPGTGTWQQAPAQPGNADWHDLSPQTTAAQGPRQLEIHRIDVRDTFLRSEQALSMLLPEQWNARVVGINWSQADLANPAEPAFQFRQQQNDETIQTLPLRFCFWSTNPSFQQTAQIGSNHMGAVVMPTPATWQDALSKVAWPQAHGMQDSPVISYRTMPEYARAYMTELPQLTNGYKCQLAAGCMRVRYNDNMGKTVDEDLMGVFGVITNPATGESNWMIDNLVEFTAPTGQLDQMEKDDAFIVGSVRPHSQWFANYLHAQQYLVARSTAADPNTVPQLQLTQGEPLNAQQTQSMQRFQLAYDKSLLAIDHGIGGVQYFQQSDGSYLPLPAGYGYAFTDGNGNYLVANTQSPTIPKDSVNAASWLPLTPMQFKKS